LFSKYSIFAERHRRVIEAAGVNGDFIPATNRVETLPGSAWSGDVASVVARPESFIEADSASICERTEAKSEGKDECR
jgi:hypothetical protein